MTVRSVVVSLRAEMAQFKKEWAEAGREVDQAGDKMQAAARKATAVESAMKAQSTSLGKARVLITNYRQEWDQVGTSFLRTGAVMGIAVAGIAKAAIDWESAFAGVRKTVQGTDAELAAVESGLRDLAQTMPTSHKEIAAVAEAAGALGIATKDIVSFTRTMVMLGDTTNLTAEEAATSFAQLANVMGTHAGDIDNLGSALVQLGNTGASTEAQILGMAQRIAGAGEVVGLTEAQVLGLASALASSGIEVEAGGSAISNVLIRISKAVSEGGAELATLADISDTTAGQFAQAWRTDPAEALVAFTQGLGKMADEGGNVFQVLDDLGLSDIRVTRALLNMANAGDLLSESFDTATLAAAENTALVEEARKRYDTTAAQISIAWNNIKDSAIGAGQAMLPILSGLADVVTAVTQAFGELPPNVQSAFGILLGGGAGLLLVAGGLMKIAGAAVTASTNLGRLQASGSRTVRAVGAIGKAAGIAAAALLAIQVAGALLDGPIAVKGVNTYTRALLDVGSGAKGARSELSQLFQQDAGVFAAQLEGIGDAMDRVAEGKGFAEKFNSFVGLGTAFDAAKSSIDQLDAALAGLVQGGAVDEAGTAFDYLSGVAKENGVSIEQLRDMLPQYGDALDQLATSSDQAGDASGQLGGKLKDLSPEAQAVADAMAEAQKEAHDLAMSFLDVDTSLKDQSFDDYIRSLEKAAEAQANWNENIIKAGAKGFDPEFLNSIIEKGPEAAGLLDELANASEEDVKRINDAFKDSEGVAQFQARLALVPPEVVTSFRAVTEDSAQKAADLANQYGLMPQDVETILRAQGTAEKDIKAVLKLMEDFDNANPKTNLDADSKKARQEARDFIAWVKKQNPKIKVDGNTDPARAAVQAFRTYVNGLKIRLPIIGTLQLNSGGMVPPGYALGGVPGYATGRVPGVPPADPRIDNVAAVSERGNLLRVRSGEWIINEIASRQNDKWLAAINSGLDMDKYLAAMVEAARGGRAGGGYADAAWDASFRAAAATYGTGAPTAATDTAGMSLVAMVDLTGLEVGLDNRGFSRFVRGEAKVVVAEDRRGRQRDLTSKIVRS